MNDAALMRRACKGDERAFCELFARYQRRIHQYASRMCGHGCADDIVQETFLALLRREGFDAAKGTVAAYLFGIARHHIVRHLTKQSTEFREAHALDAAMSAHQDTALEVVVHAEMLAIVRQAVDSLPHLYREVVVLCDLQEMDYAVVASVVQCPVGTVRSRLHRARALLAAKLTFPCGKSGL